jgi:hypothetical protein
MLALGNLKAAARMRKLDRFSLRSDISREESLKGTMSWLCMAQDATQNGGVSACYSVKSESWLGSYPETTGYIIQSFVMYAEHSGDKSFLDRAFKMAEWEIDILNPDGGTPGQFYFADEETTIGSVAFNTGQLAIGLSYVMKRRDEMDAALREKLEAGSLRVIAYLQECLNAEGYFERGVSGFSAHGRLSHNLMTAWGLHALSLEMASSSGEADGLRSTEYYMNNVNEHHWPTNTGIDEAEKDFPRTHALGYHVQGVAEVGLLADRSDMLERATDILDAALPLIDAEGNFSGRVKKNWQPGTEWNCLTGSSQFAIVYVRLGKLQNKPHYVHAANRLIQNVIGTQIVNHPNRAYDYGVRGSYPFSLKGYNRASFCNWAAKFHVDSLLWSL